MTEHQDRLREVFAKHENETPDPAAVYARVEELARKYTWRRRGAQAAGGVALSAGLIAGIANVPALLPAGPSTSAQSTTVFQPGAPEQSPSAVASSAPAASPIEMNRYFEAYFGAGYGYDNALQLAGLWNMDKEDVGAVKALAGKKLLAGDTLPVKPTPNEDTGGEDGGEELSKETAKQYDAYFNAGYDWDDAVKLAKLWRIADPSDAKAEAGKRLLAGKTLPIKPDPAQAEEGRKAKLANLFWEAGYDGADAAKLAKLWKLDDTYAAKVEAGRRLQAGETLPIKP